MRLPGRDDNNSMFDIGGADEEDDGEGYYRPKEPTNNDSGNDQRDFYSMRPQFRSGDPTSMNEKKNKKTDQSSNAGDSKPVQGMRSSRHYEEWFKSKN